MLLLFVVLNNGAPDNEERKKDRYKRSTYQNVASGNAESQIEIVDPNGMIEFLIRVIFLLFRWTSIVKQWKFPRPFKVIYLISSA